MAELPPLVRTAEAARAIHDMSQGDILMRPMRPNTVGTPAALGVCGAILTAHLAAAAPVAADTVADLRPEQWGLEAIGASKAWDQNRGSGVLIGVLGTGVDSEHPDFRDSVTVGTDFTVKKGGESAEADAAFGASGTETAGIVGARGHGQEHKGGMLGVAPESQLLSVRVQKESAEDADGAASAQGDGDVDPATALEKGIRYAVGEGAQVITLPEGMGEAAGDADVREAIDHAVRTGSLVVVPADAGYPADSEGVLAVGAADRQLRPMGGANAPAGVPAAEPTESPSAGLIAPGDQVETITVETGYTKVSGDDAAAAFAAGTAALVRAEHPQLLPDQVAEALVEGAESGGVLNAPGALSASAGAAEDIPLYDEDLADEAGDGLPVPGWTLWAGTAVLLLSLLVVGVVLLRRSMANPYGLRPDPDAKAAAEQWSRQQALEVEAEAAAAPGRRRRGRRKR
ncbi:S8 family serine peptidase [Nocardiopsis gilva]|nr:S8 family serine peptidase [Nocardiopsis gilva]